VTGAWLRQLRWRTVHWAWEAARRNGMVTADTSAGKRFAAFGRGSSAAFPPGSVFGERWIVVGEDTLIGAEVTLSAGMVPGQDLGPVPVLHIGDRCVIGRGSHIVAHHSLIIEDDVFTGPYVYITDQNHGYDDGALGHDLARDGQVEVFVAVVLVGDVHVVAGPDVVADLDALVADDADALAERTPVADRDDRVAAHAHLRRHARADARERADRRARTDLDALLAEHDRLRERDHRSVPEACEPASTTVPGADRAEPDRAVPRGVDHVAHHAVHLVAQHAGTVLL
jgi:acetyltransferase-like isoleucine patch superfamily enzyme